MNDAADSYDLVVIGGGPGGSALATIVAMQGHRVLLLEKQKFPRYQIGESLLPSTIGICHLLGVGEALERAGFTPKNGGVWYWGTRGQPGWGFDFGELPRAPVFGRSWAYQVERSKFDQLLLANARERGVVALEEHRVDEILWERGRAVGVRYTDATHARGESRIARARFVADAGGHTSPFFRHVGERVFADRFRNLALHCYYAGGKRLPPPQSGSILNVSFDKGWFWYIPLRPDLTSLGAVISVENAHLLKKGHAETMNAFIDSCPLIKEYLGDAPLVTTGPYGQYRVRKDWSYCNTRFYKDGLVLVGDAACFVDPLFSSGIHLAMYSALLAARSILTSFGDASLEERAFAAFEARYRREYGCFFDYLSFFYDLSHDKEEYFRHAREILKTDEADRHAFVRLVSGFASTVSDVAPERAAMTEGDADAHVPVPTQRADSDILRIVSGDSAHADAVEPEHGLIPSPDGMRWVEREAAQ